MELKDTIPYRKRVIRVEGHRGAGFLKSENTEEAMLKAVELNLDGVEFDVRLLYPCKS